MRTTIDIPLERVTPSPTALLMRQMVPPDVTPDERTLQLMIDTIELFKTLAKPVGIMAEIDREQFTNVLHGEGCNQPGVVIEQLFAHSTSMALFVVTVGAPVCDEIVRLFDIGDFPKASMLDSAASEGAEIASDYIEDTITNLFTVNGKIDDTCAVMRFSPGYCGWDVSGQKQLFEYLKPEEIGIDLTDSFLMQPLKSISGICVAGEKHLFDIKPDYPFCNECKSRTCTERYQALLSR